MKKNILRIFLFFLISIVSFAASFNISELDVEAKLQKDGSMLVSEAVTYDIDEINGVYFYPILVKHETESWNELVDIALDKFIGLDYADYETQKKREFEENLK